MAEESLPSESLPPSLPPQEAGAKPATRGKKDKRPLPLLSRKKLKPPRALPVEPDLTAAGVEPKQKRVGQGSALWIKIVVRVLAYAAIGGLGYGTFHTLRQTQVQGALWAPGYELPKQILIVRDFSEDLKTLRQEYVMARQPYVDDLKSKQTQLKQIQSDLSSFGERENLIQQQIANSKDEITTVIAKGQADEQRIWKDNGEQLESDYNQKLLDFENRLKDRASQLGLDYQDDPSVKSPEVWVNAFRLALYSPPKNVNPVEQRTWAESQLKAWGDYEKDQDKKKQDLRSQLDQIHKSIAPKIADINDRIKHMQSRVAETEDEAKPVRDEFDVVTGQINDTNALIKAQTAKYYAQLFDIPTRNVLDKLDVESQGRWQLRQLDQSTTYQPGGNYLMWLTIKKDGQEYWALVPFSPILDENLNILISDKAFIRARAILE